MPRSYVAETPKQNRGESGLQFTCRIVRNAHGEILVAWDVRRYQYAAAALRLFP